MRGLICFLSFFLFADTSFAKTYRSSPAAQKDILCSHLMQANYHAGVDIKGKSVVPADVNNSNTSVVNDPIVIPIQIDIAQRYGLTLPADMILEPTVSELYIFQDGRVQWNGEDVTEHMNEECGNENKTQKDQQEHRLQETDPVLSGDAIGGQYPEETSPRSPYNN